MLQTNPMIAETSLKIMCTFFKDNEMGKQANIPLPPTIEWGTPEHYSYLFYSCILNYGMKSDILHRNLSSLYQIMPSFFIPALVCSLFGEERLDDIANILRTHVHVRYPKEAAKNWLALSALLNQSYEGNPQKMLVGQYTYKEYEKIIFQVRGLGQKTGGLLLRVLIDNGLLKTVDGIGSIPIDRHDIDLSIWLQVVQGESADNIRKNKKMISQISSIWVNAANKLCVSPSIADQYLWIIGSQYCTNNMCTTCPLNKICLKIRGEEDAANLYCGSDVQ